jgi:hypothetical protein
MNTTDMYSREKVALNQQAEINRHLRASALLAENRPARKPVSRRWVLTAVGAALTTLVVTLLVISLLAGGSANLLV